MTPRRKKLLKTLIIAAVVMTSAVFFFSSSFFLTKVVLPAVRIFTGVELYIGTIDWRPWSGRLTVLNFRLGSTKDTFLVIRKAHGYYDLSESLKGIISFTRLDATEVDLHFVLGEDGVWNFYKLAGQPAVNLPGVSGCDEPEKPELFLPADTEVQEEPDGAPEWLKFNLRNVTIRNSKLGLTTGTEKTRRHICWHNLNIGGDRFQNGAPMVMQAAGNIHFISAQELTLNTYGSLSSNVTWGNTLMPDIMNMRFQLNALSGNIGSKPMDGSTLTLTLNSTYKDDIFYFSKLRLDQTKLEDQRSSLNAKGQWHTETDAFSFDFPHAFLAPEPLALFFDLAFGINPGVLHFSGDGSMSYSQNDFSSTGRWTLTRDQGMAVFGADRMELPGFKIDSEQDFSLQNDPHSIKVSKLRLTMSETGADSPAIRLNLRNPVQYRIDKESFDGSHPGLDLTVNKLNLKLLRFMFPEKEYMQFTGGVLSGNAGLDFSGNTGDSALRGSFTLDQAAFPAGNAEISGLSAGLRLDSTIDRHGEIRLHQLNTALKYRQKKLANLALSGRVSPEKQTSEVNVRIDDIQLGNPLFADYPQLEFFSGLPGLRTGISAAVSTSPELVRIQNFSLLATGNENSRISVIIQPQNFDLNSGSAVTDWQGEIEADLPLKYINTGKVSFSNGRLLLNSRLNAPDHLENCTADGSIQLQEAELSWGDIKADSLSLNHDFSCYFSGGNEIRLNAGYTYLRIAGHPALRGESRGVFNTVSGDGDLSLSVRYFNEQLIKLFYPESFDILSGKGSAQFRRENGNTHLTSQIAAGKLRRPGNKHILSGDLQLEFTGDSVQNTGVLNCSLEEQNSRIASFQISGEEDITRKKLKLAVTSDFIDGKVFQALAVPGVEQEKSGEQSAEKNIVPGGAENVSGSAAKTEPEPLFRQETDLELNLENVRLSPELQSALHGHIIFTPGRVKSRDLLLFVNSIPVPLTLQYSGEKGWVSKGEVHGELNIAPVVKYLEAEYPVDGIITGLNWDIAAPSPDKLDTLQGRIKGSVRELAVENRALHGPVMRIVMLPVEAVLRVNALIPNTADIRTHWRRIQETVLTGQNPLAKVKFDQGTFDLQAADGKVEVVDLCFTGPAISKLDFKGSMTLGDDMKLNLNSRMDMGGISLNMPIAGDIDSPEVNLTDLELALAGVQLKNIINKMTSAESSEPEQQKEPEPEKKPPPPPAAPPAPPEKPLWKKVILFWQD